jgi:hypothetical protein
MEQSPSWETSHLLMFKKFPVFYGTLIFIRVFIKSAISFKTVRNFWTTNFRYTLNKTRDLKVFHIKTRQILNNVKYVFEAYQERLLSPIYPRLF